MIYEDNDQWYFWDETGTERKGPYETEFLAELELDRYREWLDKGYIGLLYTQRAKDVFSKIRDGVGSHNSDEFIYNLTKLIMENDRMINIVLRWTS